MSNQDRRGILVSLAVAISLLSSANATAVEYTFAKIADGSTPGIVATTSRVALNQNGIVAFAASTPDNSQAVFVGNGGPLTKLFDNRSPYPFFAVRSIAINDSGQVAAMVNVQVGPQFVLLGDGTSVRRMTSGFTLVDDNVALNNSGIVAFRGSLDGTITGIYATDGDTVTTITDTAQLEARYHARAGSISKSVSINDSGVVSFMGPAGGSHILTSDGTTLTEIYSTQDFIQSYTSINESGQVAFITADAVIRGDGTDLTTIATSPASRVSINDKGQVLCSYPTRLMVGDGSSQDTFLKYGDELFGRTIQTMTIGPSSINNAGQVAFLAFFSDNTSAIVLATPIPEPATLTLLGGGVLGLLLFAWRKPR